MSAPESVVGQQTDIGGYVVYAAESEKSAWAIVVNEATVRPFVQKPGVVPKRDELENYFRKQTGCLQWTAFPLDDYRKLITYRDAKTRVRLHGKIQSLGPGVMVIVNCRDLRAAD